MRLFFSVKTFNKIARKIKTGAEKKSVKYPVSPINFIDKNIKNPAKIVSKKESAVLNSSFLKSLFIIYLIIILACKIFAVNKYCKIAYILL